MVLRKFCKPAVLALALLCLVATGAGAREAGEPGWGFVFTVPQGWELKTSQEAAALTSTAIPGIILVLPHRAADLPQIRQGMLQGLQEPNLSLGLKGQVFQMRSDLLWGDYTGTFQGNPAQARAFGALLPQGGGAFVIALAGPGGLSTPLSNAAANLAVSLRPAPPGAGGAPPGQAPAAGGDLARHFAGTWQAVSKSSSSLAVLRPDGSFAMRHSSSHGGQFRNQYGDQTGSWGTARDDRRHGRWAVMGDRMQGHLLLEYNNGNRNRIPYRVHREKGQIYWREYWFGNQLWSKSR